MASVIWGNPKHFFCQRAHRNFAYNMLCFIILICILLYLLFYATLCLMTTVKNFMLYKGISKLN